MSFKVTDADNQQIDVCATKEETADLLRRLAGNGFDPASYTVTEIDELGAPVEYTASGRRRVT